MADLVSVSRHDLGFTRLTLRLPLGRAISLHVWRNGSKDASKDRHNHAYGFVSIPLWGRFLEQRWREVSGLRPSTCVRYMCVSSRVGGHSRIGTEAVASDLVRVRSYPRYPLLPWRCRPDDIHSLLPAGDGLHLSVVWQGRLCKDTSDVWRPA